VLGENLLGGTNNLYALLLRVVTSTLLHGQDLNERTESKIKTILRNLHSYKSNINS